MTLLPGASRGSDTRRLQAKSETFVQACFPGSIVEPVERGLRALEEMLELVQAVGVSQEQALRLVAYVYARPVGEVDQELGGAALTLSAVASAVGLDLGQCWEVELDRVLGCMDQVRAKHAVKKTQGIVAEQGAPTPEGGAA